MRLKIAWLALGTLVFSQTTAAPPPTPACADSVFRFQTNFWMNLHLFLRAAWRRRNANIPVQMNVAQLDAAEQRAWTSALDAYAGPANLSLIMDGGMVRLSNTLSGVEGDGALPPSASIDAAIANALNTAAPIYRVRLWPQHRREDDDWIAAHCSDIQRFDQPVKKAIADALHATPPSGPILVDVARETGPTLAYTTTGPDGTAGHTAIAPQKNGDPELALNTILHEISHTMDDNIIDALNREAARQGVRVPEDLWHALTLYTTGEITRRFLGADGRPVAGLDVERAKMFERNGWRSILAALQKDWQPWLDGHTGFDAALGSLVHDAAVTAQK